MSGKILEWMSEIEEEGLGDEEYVPEEAIAKPVFKKVDTAARTFELSAIQQDRQSPGNTFSRHMTICF